MTQGAGDEWSGTIPGHAQGITVWYRIFAQDNNGRTNTTLNYNYIVTAPFEGDPPNLSGFSVSPSTVYTGNSITIEVTVVDDSDIAEVTLSYSTDDQASWTNVSMSESGADQWSGDIPAQYEPTNVFYRIYARDEHDNWATSGIEVFEVRTIPPAESNWMQIVGAASTIGFVFLLVIVIVKKRSKKPKYRVPPYAPPEELEVLRPPEPTPVAAKVAAKPEAEVVEKTVKALRGGEIVGGQFEYKIKIKNDSEFVINNVVVTIVAYPEDCMTIDGNVTKKITRIEPDGFRSPQFIFKPTKDCVEGRVQATVSYVDHHDNTQILSVEPYTIRSVCDLLTPLDVSMEDFDLMLYDMAATSERVTLDWNPQVLVTKANVLLPMKNFQLIESKGEIVDGEYRGVIRGLAEGKYTGKRVAIRISVTGDPDGDTSIVLVEGLGDDEAMLPTTVHELAEGIQSWICMNCGAPLNPNEVADIKSGRFVTCRYCTHTLTADLYKKRG